MSESLSPTHCLLWVGGINSGFRRGRDALDILLFDQFGNYVVQRLFSVAIEVYEGRRVGDKTWFGTIATRVMQSEASLRRYSSGKKLLRMVQDVLKQCAFSSQPPQTHLLSASTARQPPITAVYPSMMPMHTAPTPYSEPVMMYQLQAPAASYQSMLPPPVSVPFSLPITMQQAVDGWCPFG
jgi:hypothetical protein